MKSTVLALLAANAQAQTLPLDGTSREDFGGCDQWMYEWYFWDVREEPQCTTNADCADEEETSEKVNCAMAFVDDEGAWTDGFCVEDEFCTADWAAGGQERGESEQTWGIICHDATTEATGEDLTIEDFIYWDENVNGELDTCTDDSDCTTSGYACGTNVLDTLSGTYCVPMDGWCSVDNVDGGSFYVSRSENFFTTTCTSDAYYEWLWSAQNTAAQIDAAGCATVDPRCYTITWDGETYVDAWCGTATLDSDSSYSVLGCYPLADCETEGGSIPGSDTLTYNLVCSASKLAATAAAAVVLASSI